VDRFDGVVARLTHELLQRCQDLNRQITALEHELRDLVRRLAPALLAVPGCGVLSAALIIGETAGIHRFRDKDAFARFTGTAPVPVWSGSSKGKVRLNRRGNRAMNYALHMIAVTKPAGSDLGGPTSTSRPVAAKIGSPLSGCYGADSLTSSMPA
jgi:transposase